MDSISEKDLNKFVINSNNPKSPHEFQITSLTIYRPFVEDQLNAVDSNPDDDDSSSQQDNEQQHDDQTQGQAENKATNGSTSLNNVAQQQQQQQQQPPHTQNGLKVVSKTGEEAAAAAAAASNGTPKPINRPMSSSTPMRGPSTAIDSETGEPTQNGGLYPIEEILIHKINGAMGLSIVGGGNVACHPFGVDKPGIFISKIVPEGPASLTSLRVGDRILKVGYKLCLLVCLLANKFVQ